MYTPVLRGFGKIFTGVHSRIRYKSLTPACKSFGVLKKILLFLFSQYESFEIYLISTSNHMLGWVIYPINRPKQTCIETNIF